VYNNIHNIYIYNHKLRSWDMFGNIYIYIYIYHFHQIIAITDMRTVGAPQVSGRETGREVRVQTVAMKGDLYNCYEKHMKNYVLLLFISIHSLIERMRNVIHKQKNARR